MKEKEEVVNINFFKKVWYSISKFEQYPAMATEGLWRAIKYLTTLTIIVTIFLMIGSLLKIKTLIGNFAQYVNDNIPEFSYSDGKLNIESEESIIIEDIEEVGLDKIIINIKLSKIFFTISNIIYYPKTITKYFIFNFI